MRQRVLHSPSAPPETTLHDTLVRIEQAVVFAADSDAALGLLLKKSAALLYFSRANYEYAMRRLAAPQRDEAILQRLKAWSPNAINQGIEWIYRQERRCLHLAAPAGPGGAFEQSLRFLHRVTNEGRYGSLTLAEMLINVLESEALLITELSRPGAAAEGAARNEFDLAIGRELRALGRPEFAEHLPQAKPLRGTFVTPRDTALMKSLRSRREPFVEWQDGLVARFGERDIERMSRQKKVTILYPFGGVFLQDVSELSQGQLHREFAERSERIAQDFGKVWAEYANDLRLNTALLRIAAHERAAKENASLAAVLAGQIERETPLLASALRQHPAPPGSDPAANLSEANQEILEDIQFLSKLCAALGPADLHRRYESLAALKKTHLRTA